MTPIAILMILYLSAIAWGGEAGWQKEWSDLLAGARKEGKVAVMAPPDPETRVKLPARFRERFGIELEYIGASFGSGGARKVLMERRAGLYTLVRQAKLGASCRVEVPAEQGLTNHSYRVLQL